MREDLARYSPSAVYQRMNLLRPYADSCNITVSSASSSGNGMIQLNLPDPLNDFLITNIIVTGYDAVGKVLEETSQRDQFTLQLTDDSTITKMGSTPVDVFNFNELMKNNPNYFRAYRSQTKITFTIQGTDANTTNTTAPYYFNISIHGYILEP